MVKPTPIRLLEDGARTDVAICYEKETNCLETGKWKLLSYQTEEDSENCIDSIPDWITFTDQSSIDQNISLIPIDGDLVLNKVH